MNQVPEQLKYTTSHEWLDAQDQVATVGITDHAQELLGDLVFVVLPRVGQEVSAGDELGVVESVKAAADYYAPISGTVMAVNQAVVDNPALLNQSPYSDGWLVKLSIKTPTEMNQLLGASDYGKLIAEDH